MSIFSRRKRRLHRTPKPPKMSSRRQFHRALRRHPAWPIVMEQAATRARAQESIRRDRAAVMETGTVSPRKQLRRALRRNRALLVTLLAVGGLIALLTGISLAQGEWIPVLASSDNPNSNPPSPRFGAATATDLTNKEVVIFGGFGHSAGALLNLGGVVQSQIGAVDRADSTWVYQAINGRWFDRSKSAIHSPSPRGFASMAYDGARRNVVLFGGARYGTNDVSDETWTWDGKDWTLRHPPEPRPQARQNASMVYDAHRKVVVMFGGRGVLIAGQGGQPSVLNDTWTWDGSVWKIMPIAGAPPPRHSAAMAYDVCRAEAVMFGGQGIANAQFVDPAPSETWTWNGAKWTPQTPRLSPTARIGASMSYSNASGRVLLYGGLYATDAGVATAAVDTDVWRWDGGGFHGVGPTWEKMNSEVTTANTVACFVGGPYCLVSAQAPSRAYASFTANPADDGRSFFLLYGGTPATSSSPVAPVVAMGDQFTFGERLGSTDELDDTPLARKCSSPVPIPSDEAAAGDQIDQASQAPKAEVREEIREIGRLPVLIGTPWPAANRPTTGLGNPNPNATPAPDCPNREDGETGANTRPATDPKRNRVYQFFICDPITQFSKPTIYRLLIGVYDGTTLKPLGSAIVPLTGASDWGSAVNNFDNDNLLFHDVDRGRFLLRDGSSGTGLWVIQQDLIEKGIDPVVKKYAPTGGVGNAMSFFNHPKTGRAKLLVSNGTSIRQLDLDTNNQDWVGAVPNCPGKPMRSGNRAYATYCIYSSGQPESARYAVVRLPITELADGSEKAEAAEVFPGPFAVKKSWGDPEAERILLRATNIGGDTLWVFDGKVSRFVGRVGLSATKFGLANAMFGLDQETGRFYAHLKDDQGSQAGQRYSSPGGLLAVDSRLTPVSQANSFTQFSSPAGSWIVSLPAGQGLPRRVFIRRAGGNMKTYPDGAIVTMPNEMFYLVLADTLPLPEKTDISQLDALTIPVAETPGKTEVSFDAEGSGYGIRLRSVGGIWSALRPPASMYQQGGGGEEVEGRLGPIQPAVPACVYPDRELAAGWVPQVRLSNLDAAARSTGLEVDSTSKADLKRPFTACKPPADPSNFPPTGKPVYDVLWPLLPFTTLNTSVGPNLAWDKFFHEVECVGDASNVTQTAGADISSSASCNQKGEPKDDWTEGTARGAFGPAAANAAFSVGEGYSKVTVARDPVKGIVVTSTAVATGIRLPNLSIGHITTTAVAWSNGRPGEGRASFTRMICNVNPPLTVNPQNSNESAPNTGCLTPSQQAKMAKDFNDKMGINGKMIIPTYDSELYKGSPGGYIAGVIKPFADEIEDQLFVKDFQREVPALVIEFYKDSLTQGLARQVLQLAAVRAVTGFGVQCGSDLVYSAPAKNCIALTFEDDPVGFEVEDEGEEEFSSSGEAEFDAGGVWTPVATSPPEGLALGKRLGRFIENLPIIRQLPIRQMGEALLAASVWLLLGMPMLFAGRRLTINLGRNN